MFLDAGPGDGFPWWVLLMMPLMMIGMGGMMWFMMRMMMGMGGHDPSRGSTHSSTPARGEQVSESEVTSLRQQLAELQQRLAAMEFSTRGQGDDNEPPLVAPNEGGAPASGKGEAP